MLRPDILSLKLSETDLALKKEKNLYFFYLIELSPSKLRKMLNHMYIIVNLICVCVYKYIYIEREREREI